ncbi:hypothetical protein [Actinomadura sp. WMMA1423]|uniref:hypothetical protein n=1 Tax=Actinomadura sp. WMMA1423 TaxID=2591108 RepID=UPI001147362A|nr:hypothetical protein [Actinomadura sp. WMMA1423]
MHLDLGPATATDVLEIGPGRGELRIRPAEDGEIRCSLKAGGPRSTEAAAAATLAMGEDGRLKLAVPRLRKPSRGENIRSWVYTTAQATFYSFVLLAVLSSPLTVGFAIFAREGVLTAALTLVMVAIVCLITGLCVRAAGHDATETLEIEVVAPFGTWVCYRTKHQDGKSVQVPPSTEGVVISE